MERRHRQPGVPGGSSNQGDTAFYCSRNSTICVSRKKYGYDADDYESFLGTPLGDREHGTRETLIHWIDRVFYMTTLQGCNTRGCPPGKWPERRHPGRVLFRRPRGRDPFPLGPSSPKEN